MMTHTHLLPDTRPYPDTPVKNDLLLYAHQIVANTGATQKLARENLHSQIANMFQLNHTLSLSVALNMVSSSEEYAAIMDEMAKVIDAKNDEEQQWLALPVVVVVGSNQPCQLNNETPIAALNKVFAQYEHLNVLSSTTWAKHLLTSEDFTHIKAEQWFNAKKDIATATQFLENLPNQVLQLTKTQSVNILYAIGFAPKNVQAALAQNLRQAAMSLMKVWQDALNQDGVTLFANPLAPNNPILALTQADTIRTQMALDVFSANAIRNIRLQSPRVGVIIAAQEGGNLLFGFDNAEPTYDLPTQVFTWHLSPRDNIASIQQNFIDLMSDCQVENIYVLHNALPENTSLPSYHKAHEQAGHNPLFSNC